MDLPGEPSGFPENYPPPPIPSGPGALAEWWRRAVAILLDAVIVGVPVGIIGTVIGLAHVVHETTAQGQSVRYQAGAGLYLFSFVVSLAYWPAVVLISLALLTSLYHLAIPVRTPWRRALPGAVVGLGLWVGGAVLLRWWLTIAFSSTTTYGPLSAPIAVLVFMYLTALAILLGAELNAEFDRLWPAQATEQARREEEEAEGAAPG